MKKSLLFVGIGAVSVIALIALLLPQILSWIGLHPAFDRAEFDLEGKKALIIATNHDTLGDPEDGVATGVFASELTIAYYEFLDAGMAVDIASIEGGEIPFEPVSLRWPLATHADRRYLDDADAQNKTQNSLSIADVDFTDYDIIWMAGGWGAAYDLGFSQELGDKISAAHAEGILLGSVCHGALGFLMAIDVDGSPLVEGRTMTAVTDKQVEELGIGITPQHPETELRRLGANFVANTAFRDFFATLTVVDGNIITGQNQNSSGETAQTLLAMLAEKS
jgi:putative intracellular protease/amidase